MRYGVGLGSSGARARPFVDGALQAMAQADVVELLGVSGRYASAAVGGVTDAPFVNAAVVVESALAPEALLRWLFSLERRFGRVRGARYGGRSLDLDLLWAQAPVPVRPALVLPHPRLTERPFAVVPLLEAMRRAGVPPPLWLLAAAAGDPRAKLPPLVAPA